jgi:hypothetical protein
MRTTFPPDVIILALRWYLRYTLSYRDVEELLAERGITVDHVTIYRWAQRFTPELIDAARPSRHVAGDRSSPSRRMPRAGRNVHHSARSLGRDRPALAPRGGAAGQRDQRGFGTRTGSPSWPRCVHPRRRDER